MGATSEGCGVDPFAASVYARKRRTKAKGVVIKLPPRMAKGRYPKGKGFNRQMRVDRGFIRGDRITTTEEATWLLA